MSGLAELLFNVREKRDTTQVSIALEQQVMAEKQHAMQLLHSFMQQLNEDDSTLVSQKVLLCYAYSEYDQFVHHGELRSAFGLSDQGLQHAILQHRENIIRSAKLIHSCDLLIEYLQPRVL